MNNHEAEISQIIDDIIAKHVRYNHDVYFFDIEDVDRKILLKLSLELLADDGFNSTFLAEMHDYKLGEILYNIMLDSIDEEKDRVGSMVYMDYQKQYLIEYFKPTIENLIQQKVWDLQDEIPLSSVEGF